MKVTVLQPGARHAYLQSRFLYRAGLLQRLYTDFAIADHAGARLLARLAPTAALRAKIRRRTVAEIPQRLIRQYPDAARQNRTGRPADWPISSKDLAQSDLYFTQYYSGGHGLRERARPGAKIVADVFTVPSTHRIVNAECERFPEWGERPWDDALNQQYESFTHDMLEDCDALFCPAQSVIEDIASHGEKYRAKCMLVPYGSSLTFPAKVHPESRRVLFAGTITLRKGPQYVKMAADLLADAGYTFVFAGNVSEAAANQLAGDNVELLGHVSKERMAAEYARADVFVLPSLAEGSAGVVLEAMSAGLPVVATRNAGVDFTDGEAGIYVPECDGEAIAHALETICGDRDRRESMSRAARLRAGAYDHSRWEECFVSSIRRVHEGARDLSGEK
ncbi:glycosyltransferase family 4 protein [Erythrobacter sp. THAF29]|uniref:glycosyltransferase family 4 protein n=1 Tax=Erythrobacter sp. THAF29 TaxID=2587851 RepID=UPI0012690D0F|nr:glycosyltransferase family 4 protein [Erythrobacter sp. THAF29]QFT76314.1 Alpha-D-kanosaminyltransferase [Erythrobacter sp. THAF29]